jgi:VanZ family protein
MRLWLGRGLGLGLVGAVIFLSLTSSPPEAGAWLGSDKLGHLLAYAVLMAWHGWFYRDSGWRWAWAVFFVTMGMGLEVLQGLGGVRTPEVADAVANGLGVALGWLVVTVARGLGVPAVGRPRV